MRFSESFRNADVIVYRRAASEAASSLDVVRREVAAAGIEKPAIVALTKADELGEAGGDDLRRACTTL